MNKLEDLINYYINLLIIQYHNKPKARATIRAFVGELLTLYVLFRELEYAFDLNKAMGKQLDIAAKYFGVVRKFVGLNFKYKYFSFQYQGGDEEGLSFRIIGQDDEGKLRTLRAEKTYQYDLDDNQFRTLLKLRAIALHNETLSYEYIKKSVYEILGDTVMVEIHPDMSIDYYFTDANLVQIFETYDKLLPAPAGVKITAHTLDELNTRFTMKVLQSNGGGGYNSTQKGMQTLTKPINGKWQVLPENQEEDKCTQKN